MILLVGIYVHTHVLLSFVYQGLTVCLNMSCKALEVIVLEVIAPSLSLSTCMHYPLVSNAQSSVYLCVSGLSHLFQSACDMLLGQPGSVVT